MKYRNILFFIQSKKNKAVFEKEKFEFIEFAITDLNILSDI